MGWRAQREPSHSPVLAALARGRRKAGEVSETPIRRVAPLAAAVGNADSTLAGGSRYPSFQPGAGNDFAAAYAAYGDRLAFATGIDIQRGERMTPEALRQEILDAYATGATKGRLILGTRHMVQYSMPEENLRAILSTVREIQAAVHPAARA